jgi:NAD(P)-dependent dehydrogenase (short-subunit alcohol dehydrogenase family)
MGVKLKRIEDQVVVITGASSGIGLATARLAAERGARVVLVARDPEGLAAARVEIEGRGGRAATVVADVASFEDVRTIAKRAVEAFGGFDTWVNNAGLSIYGPVEEVPVEDARRLFDVNYWGVVHGSLTAIAHLKTNGGAVINLGSVVSDRAIPLQGH